MLTSSPATETSKAPTGSRRSAASRMTRYEADTSAHGTTTVVSASSSSSAPDRHGIGWSDRAPTTWSTSRSTTQAELRSERPMTSRMYAPESSRELPTIYSACSYDQVAPSDSTKANSASIHSGSVSAS